LRNTAAGSLAARQSDHKNRYYHAFSHSILLLRQRQRPSI
jgi:hypothetical protein